MKYKRESIGQGKNILANNHFVSVPYDCSGIAARAADGVIPAGTIVPSNDAAAFGVLLSDVYPDENPNGAVVIHGFISRAKLAEAPDEAVKLPLIQFVD